MQKSIEEKTYDFGLRSITNKIQAFRYGMVERVTMKIQNIRLLYFFCMLSVFTGVAMQSCYAQELPADQQLVLVADEMYNFGDVKDALEVYVQALEMNPKNERANFMAGKAYLTTTQKDLALKYLIKS